MKTKPQHYHCQNDDCQYHQKAIKNENKKGGHKRWKILTAYLAPGSFVFKTYCPICKWELRIGMDKEKEVDDRPVSALDLLKAIAPNAK